MVAPTGFESNMQAAEDNFFMAGAKEGGLDATQPSIRRKVLEEYQGLYKVLSEDAGLKVQRLSAAQTTGSPHLRVVYAEYSVHFVLRCSLTCLYGMPAHGGATMVLVVWTLCSDSFVVCVLNLCESGF